MISTLNSSTNRITGLASGLETEDLVQQLTSAMRTRVEKAEQDKQLLEWKQDAYREVSTALVGFHNKYFNGSSGALFADSLQKLSVTSSDPAYVSAVSTSGVSAAQIYIKNIVSLASGAKLKSSGGVSAALAGTVDAENLSALSGKSMTVTLNGVSKKLTFSDRAYSSPDEAAEELRALLKNAFGDGGVQVNLDEGELRLSAEAATIALKGADSAEDDALALLGFESGASNRISLTQSLRALPLGTPVTAENVSFKINGTEFSFSAETSLSSVIGAVNGSGAGVTLSYSKLTDSFTMISRQTGAASSVAIEDTEGSFLSAIFGEGVFTAGTNAVVRVGLDGETGEDDLVTVTRDSNTFDINGTVITLNKKADAGEAENVTIGAALDTDAVIGKIKDFVADYNALLDLINGKLAESKYKGFLPLTDEQKEGLSESDQTAWTEKAKSGLLRNDLYLQGIVGGLRSSFYAPVSALASSGANAGPILSDIGVTTGAYTENGKLTVDSEKLRAALERDPSGVFSLLTQKSAVGYSQYNTPENKALRYKQSGLLWRVSDIVKNNISKIGIKGPLIDLAGSPETSFAGITAYGKKISEAADRISALNNKLLEQEDYYWTRFTQMETALSSLNSQSSWLSAMTSKS